MLIVWIVCFTRSILFGHPKDHTTQIVQNVIPAKIIMSASDSDFDMYILFLWIGPHWDMLTEIIFGPCIVAAAVKNGMSTRLWRFERIASAERASSIIITIRNYIPPPFPFISAEKNVPLLMNETVPGALGFGNSSSEHFSNLPKSFH